MFSRTMCSVSLVLTLSFCASPGQAGPLVGYWSFDSIQGTLVPDQSGSGNDGTIKGAPQQIDGPLGKALQFGGVDAAKIKKITIGVGSRTNPVQGGAGRIYIDDIRVMKGGN